MTLGELKEILATHYADLPDDTPVLTLSDEEGNEVHDLNWVGTEHFRITSYHGEIELVHPDDLLEYLEDEDTPVHVGLVLAP